uniref:DUF2357 domain-containing protein n=1 Tax=Ignisphaera aggregans TaxID=334771 RepID=A0A7J3YTK9_9CREN
MKSNSKSILEEYLEALYREVLSFYKYGLPLPKKAVENLITSMLRPPKRFFKSFDSEEVAKAISARNSVKGLLGDLLRVVDEAHRYLVTKRGFEFEESWSLKGAIVWPSTIRNILSFKSPVIATCTRVLSEPEYVLLKSVIMKAVNILSSCEKELSNAIEKAVSVVNVEALRSLAPKGFVTLASYVLNEIRLLINELRDLVEEYPLKFVHVAKDIDWTTIDKLIKVIKAKPWRPKWVEEVIVLRYKVEEAEHSLRSLVNIVEVLHKRVDKVLTRDVSSAVRFLAFRLYEVYTYMVTVTAVVNALEGSIADVLKRGVRVYYDYGKSLIVVYGRKPGASIIESSQAKWLSGETISREELAKLTGRPDVGVYNEIKIIIEAKFSNSLPYLTQARFKTLAYLYEYNANTGILVYPGPITGKGIDYEEQNTKKLLRKAFREGGLEVRLSEDKKLYILPLPPTQTQNNIEKMQKIIKVLLS